MATTEGTKIVTPVSQIVWGHPGKQRPRTDNNGKPILKQDGTPTLQFVHGLAIPKQGFLATVWPAMQAEAAKGFPAGAPSNFAWKYDDGDDTRPVNGGGVPYAQREGYPGCYVLTIASALDNPPPFFRFNPQTGGYDQIPIDAVKTGDFIVEELNIVCNIPEQRTHTPSLYINPTGLEFIGYGKEIVSAAAINPMAAFGGRQHQLPPGASAIPVGGAPAGMGMPTQPGPGATPMSGAPGIPPSAPMQQQPGYPAQQQPMQQYAPPQQMQPQYQPAPVQQPGYPQQQPNNGYPAQQPQQLPPPAHDFVQPGMPPQYQPAPMQQYAPQPNNGYPQPQQQQPGPGGYVQPGMIAPR